mmetsp:Transcript_124257/g.247635  ORF Transcript_124257/g.247635 Transcript_124257/m.247635 type:complete len:303 (-) Transcript_124257:41-949(-)
MCCKRSPTEPCVLLRVTTLSAKLFWRPSSLARSATPVSRSRTNAVRSCSIADCPSRTMLRSCSNSHSYRKRSSSDFPCFGGSLHGGSPRTVSMLNRLTNEVLLHINSSKPPSTASAFIGCKAIARPPTLSISFGVVGVSPVLAKQHPSRTRLHCSNLLTRSKSSLQEASKASMRSPQCCSTRAVTSATSALSLSEVLRRFTISRSVSNCAAFSWEAASRRLAKLSCKGFKPLRSLSSFFNTSCSTGINRSIADISVVTHGFDKCSREQDSAMLAMLRGACRWEQPAAVKCNTFPEGTVARDG